MGTHFLYTFLVPRIFFIDALHTLDPTSPPPKKKINDKPLIHLINVLTIGAVVTVIVIAIGVILVLFIQNRYRRREMERRYKALLFKVEDGT